MTRVDTNATDLLAQLAPWLAEHAPQIGPAVEMIKFSVGQSNPTYELITKQGRYVFAHATSWRFIEICTCR